MFFEMVLAILGNSILFLFVRICDRCFFSSQRDVCWLEQGVYLSEKYCPHCDVRIYQEGKLGEWNDFFLLADRLFVIGWLASR